MYLSNAITARVYAEADTTAAEILKMSKLLMKSWWHTLQIGQKSTGEIAERPTLHHHAHWKYKISSGFSFEYQWKRIEPRIETYEM